MMKKSNIIIVDDEPASIHLLANRLKSSHNLFIASDGKEAATLIDSKSPDLIVLDVMLPDINGYDLCRTIKRDEIFKWTPVIFVSGEKSMEEKLKGYDAGGSDYVSKPYDVDILVAKIERNLKQASASKALLNEYKSATATANSALNTTMDLGLVIKFLMQTYQCQTYDEIAQHIFKTLNIMGLQSCIQIHTDLATKEYSSTGAMKSLEFDLIDQARSKGNIVEFGKRYFYNFERFSILVKNMPHTDYEKCERLKENLRMLFHGADEKLRFITLEKRLARRHIENVGCIINQTHNSLQHIESILGENKEINKTLSANLLLEMEATLPSMGLNEEQESYIIGMLDNKLCKLQLQESAINEVHKAFDDIIKNLQEEIESNSPSTTL